eukprot:11293124-Alexandrium_andersonii.AAC.1
MAWLVKATEVAEKFEPAAGRRPRQRGGGTSGAAKPDGLTVEERLPPPLSEGSRGAAGAARTA